MTSAQREWSFGSISLRFEAPDLLCHKIQGVITVDDCHALLAIYRELGSQEPFFSVVDLSEALTIGEEGRRYVSENLQPEWFAGVIFIRARLLHKAVATGISLVQRLAGKPVTPTHFVSTEEEARALAARLHEQRARGRAPHL